jgi:membrane protein
VKDIVGLFRRAGLRFSRDGFAFLAQALAFNAIFAIFPLVILAVASLAYIYGNDAGQANAASFIGTLAPEVRDVLTENLHHVVQFRGISGVLALGALLWSGKNLFQGLAYALNRALDIENGRHLILDIAVALVMLPIVGLLFLLASTAPLAVAFLAKYGVLHDVALASNLISHVAGAALIFVVATVLYDWLPNRRVRIGFGIPGAVFVTFAWELAQIAFAIYTTHVDFRYVYGTLAALAVLLVWFYYMAAIFLFGAQLCAQWDARGTSPVAQVVART